MTWDYGFGVVKSDTANGTPHYAIRVGNAQSGGLTTAYDGKAPGNWDLEGAVLLGTGGDNSNTSYGTFFEGAITVGPTFRCHRPSGPAERPSRGIRKVGCS